MSFKRRSLQGAAILVAAVPFAVGAAWALQAAPQQARPLQQPPAATTPPSAQPAPVAPAPPKPVQQPAPSNAAPPPEPAPPPAADPVPAKPVATAPAKPAEPAKRGRYGVAIIQALDKVTTETMRFEAPVGQPIRYKTLVFTARACEVTAPDELAPDQIAYLTIDTQPKALPGRAAPAGRQVFKGWMYANSPGLNPLQHPVYDAWLIACKTSAPVAAGPSK